MTTAARAERRNIIPDHAFFIPANLSAIPAKAIVMHAILSATHAHAFVIPAKAGIHLCSRI
ncbi:MAG: hypothetical protein AMXMBFR84_10460 [Candidatus Hydrogenedentota bacterium]